MSDGIDLGPFDIAFRAEARVEWLTDTEDPMLIAMRENFQGQLNRISKQFQVVFAHRVREALKSSHKCVEDTGFNDLYDQGGANGVPDFLKS